MNNAPVQNNPQSPDAANGHSANTPPPVKTTPAIKAPVTFGTRLLRWLLLIFVLFGFGFLTAIFILYNPARGQVKQLQAELQTARETRTALDQQVTGLTGQVNGLSAEVAAYKSASLQSAVAEVYADVLTAQLALARNDPGLANLALSNTADRLSQVTAQLSIEQGEAALGLQEPLKKVVDSLAKKDFPAAQTELELLASKLLVLLKALKL